MPVEHIAAEGGVVIRLVVLVEGERDSVVLGVEDLDQLHEHVVVGPVAVQGEVQVLGETPGRAEDQLAQACPTLESEVVHDAGVEERAQGVGQDNVPLGDELVA
jgi:hypothetical protein